MDDFDDSLRASHESAAEELLNSPESTKPFLNLDQSTWEGWINSIILYAAQNPFDFLYYVLLFLSPFFLLSVILSLKLARALEAQEKETKKKAKKDANLLKARRVKAD